ncbi:MAG: hypothetical protein HY057_13915 [Rhodospirillales bacterium]|nr:hypothetical protein [Rhodospirillales bacterium]
MSAIEGGGILRDRQGGAATAFALIVPVMLSLSLMTLEMVLIGFDMHRAAEASRRAARLATILPPVANLAGIAPGTKVVCKSTNGNTQCTGGALETAATFDTMAAQMKDVFPGIAPANIEITYSYSGIGDLAMPGGALPLVTVRLVGLQHPLTVIKSLPGIGSAVPLPAFTTTSLGGGYKPPA